MESIRHRIGSDNFKKRLLLEHGYRQSTVKIAYWDMRYSHVRRIMKVLEALLKVSGLWKPGIRNSLDYKVTENRIESAHLPQAFDGFRVLHLSDLHIDAVPDAGESLKEKVLAVEAEMLVLTGDFRFEPHLGTEETLYCLRSFLKGLHYPFGIYAVLGNHDALEMIEPLEAVGVRFLLNESVRLERGGQALYLAGVDDPHFFQLHDLERALRGIPRDAYRVLLAHSPEIAAAAAETGIHAYFCGHSHGGQICLPGGAALFGNLRCGRRFFKGAWRERQMTGYTSSGTGTSGVPVRFFSRPEIVLHRFFRAPEIPG